jgi:hypothetical protein
MNKYIKYISAASGLLIGFLLIPQVLYSQIPRDLPRPTGPIDFSETSNMIIFAIIPAIIIIVYLIFRKKIKKVKQEKNGGLSERND